MSPSQNRQINKCVVFTAHKMYEKELEPIFRKYIGFHGRNYVFGRVIIEVNNEWIKDKDSTVFINLYELLESYKLPRVIVRTIGLFVEGFAKYFKTSLLKSLYFAYNPRSYRGYLDKKEEYRRGRYEYSYPFGGRREEVGSAKLWKRHKFPSIMEGWRKKYPLGNPKLEINLGGRTLETYCILRDWSMDKVSYSRNSKEGGKGIEEEKEELLELNPEKVEF